MKEYCKMLKRGLAMLLAVVMVLTSSNLGVVLRAAATETENPNAVSITLGKLIAGQYDELTDNEKLIIQSGQLNADDVYSYVVPTDGGSLIKIEKADELNEVVGDEVKGKITASTHDEWYPVSYTILVDGKPVENFENLPMNNGVAYYTFDGSNAFSVEVTYYMDVDLTEYNQAEMLSAGALLAADIEKLVGLKTNIVPEKPEGWEDCKTEQERIDRFGQEVVDEVKKHEALMSFVKSAASSILGGATLELNPMMVLTFMTMELPDSESMPISKFFGEGMTLVGLLGELYNGIRYPLEDGMYIELPDGLDIDENDLFALTFEGDDENGGWVAELGFAQSRALKQAVERLLKQGVGDDENEPTGLLLKNFLTAHASKSYLEWLVNPAVRAELVAALIGDKNNGNYNDILAMTGGDALVKVSTQLEDLQYDLDVIEEAAWDLITKTAAEYGMTIESEEDLNALLADGFDGLLKEYAESEGINRQLADLNDQISEYSEYGVKPFKKDTIEGKQDLVDFIAYLESTKGTLSAAVDTIYSRWDSALREAGYTGAEIRTVAEAKNAIVKMENNAKAELTKINAAKNVVANLLKDYPDAPTVNKIEDIADAITYLYGLQSSDELDAANKALNAAKAAAKALAESYGLKNVAINSSADIDAIVAANGPLDKQVEDALAAYNSRLDEVNTLLSTYLADLPDSVTLPKAYETIDSADEFAAFCDWMETELANKKAEFTKTLGDINSAVKDANDKLPSGFEKCTVVVNESDDAETLKSKIGDIRTWMNGLVTTANGMKADALAEANATLTSYEQLADYVEKNGEIESVADIDKLSAYVDEKFATLTADIYTGINEHEKMDDVRVVYGYVGEDVESIQDVRDIVTYMENDAEAYVWEQVNFEIAIVNEKIDQVNTFRPGTYERLPYVENIAGARSVVNQMKAYGFEEYTYTLESCIEAVELIPTVIDYLNEVIDNLEKLENTKADIKTTLTDARAQFVKAESDFAEMQDLVAEYGELLDEAEEKLPEAKNFIADAESLINDGTLADLENNLYNLKGKHQDLENDLTNKKNAMRAEQAKIVAAEKALDDARKELGEETAELVAGLEKQRDNWAKAEQAKAEYEEIAQAMTDNLELLDLAAEIDGYQDDIDGYLEELPAQLEEAEKAWATLETIPDSLKTLEDTRKELQSVKDMLDIMITLLELLCDALESAATACGKNAWNAPSLLKAYNSAANYAELTAAATGLEANNIDPIEKIVKYTSTKLTANMSMYNVSVVAKAQIVDENNNLVELNTFNAGPKTLVAGADAKAIEEAIAGIMTDEVKTAMFEHWNGLISETNYNGVYSEIPSELTADLEVVLAYAPKSMEVTANFDGLEETYLYGWNLVLPVHENTELEWEYTVKIGNGETLKLRQGSKITITGNTTITRVEGAASESVGIIDLVIGTTSDLSETAKDILNSSALKLGGVVYVRMPNGDMITVERVDGQTVVTAPNYDSNVAGDWKVYTGVMDGETVPFENGKFTTSEVFKKIIVSYQLSLTPASLGLTGEQLSEYLNAPYILASDYKFQKEKLDTLIWALSTNDPASGETANLEGLSMLDRGYEIEMSSLTLTLGMALTAPDTYGPMVGNMFGLSEAATAALTNVLFKLDEILPRPEGPHPLYKTLNTYATSENGMLHYYQNEQTYISQLNELNAIMGSLPMDELAALPAAFYDLFNTISSALGNAAALGNEENRIRTDLIDVTSTALPGLLNNLAKYGDVKEYATPDALTWVVPFSKGGPDSVTYTVTVTVEGAGTVTETFVKNMDEGFDAVAEAARMLAAKGWLAKENEEFYSMIDGSVGNNYVYNYNYKMFPVEVPGGETAVVSLANQTVTLPGHPDPAFAYEYNVAGTIEKVFNSNVAITLTPAQFKALTIGGAKITVAEVNVAENTLIATIEGMGGVLYKDEAGKYSVVIGIDMNDMNGLIGFIMGLYTSNDVKLGGETLVANGQFHLQTLVDALLNSGISTNELNANINANGTVKNTLVLPEGLTVVGNKTLAGNHMTLIESTLTLGSLETMPLYLTLTGNASTVKGALNTVSGYGVDVVLENGSANLAVTIPEAYYTAYLAALSMVGEVDLRNVNDVNAEIALGYITNMITEIMNTEGVTIDTFGKTIGMDLSAYESYYDMAKGLMNLVEYGEDGCTIILDLPIIPIKSVIDSAAGSIQLPIEGISLGDMIAEYEIGLKLGVGAKVNNFANEYDVLFVDVKAGGLEKMFGMKKLDETGKLDLTTTSVVVLLKDIENLYIPDTMTLVDLNGFNVTGTIKGGASADVIVVDSNYVADEGVVGNVSGNVTLLAGKYLTDVSAYVNDGYMQDSNGVVCNKMFTVSETNDVITVTLNTTVADAKTLLTQEGVIGLAAEILFDQFINHYNVAGVSMGDNKIYNINFEDILGIVSGGTGEIIDTALAFVDEAQLSNVFNTLVAQLTDYAAIGKALSDEGTGVIASNKFTTYTWGLDLDHNADNDTLAVNFGGAYGKSETKTLQLEIEGEARGAMATLATALGNVLRVDLRVELEDIYRNDAGQFNVKGDFTGSVVFDFTVGDYGVMMALVLANGADADLKADLVEAIEYYYGNHFDTYLLRKVFNNLTVEDVCSALANGHNSTTTISEIVENLGLTCGDDIMEKVDDSEMGFDLVIDAMAAALRLLDSYGIGESVTNSGAKLGRLETSDDKGYYYGRSGSKGISGSNSYLDYALNAETIELKVYLFGEHVCAFTQEVVSDEYLKSAATYESRAEYYCSCICGKSSKGITDETFFWGEALVKAPVVEIEVENIKIGGNLYGVKYDEAKGYLILDTIADGMTVAQIKAALTQGTEVENDADNKAELIASNVVGKNGLVGTGSTFTLQAKNRVDEIDEVTVTIIILGDTNCDGSLNSGDAVLMNNYVLHREAAPLSDVQKLAGNANGLASIFSRDGIDSGDAVIVMNKWLKRYSDGKLGDYKSPLEN